MRSAFRAATQVRKMHQKVFENTLLGVVSVVHFFWCVMHFQILCGVFLHT